MPADRLRRLYDLRAQRFAFSSFEIAFKAPAAARQESVEEEEKTLDDVGALLERALGWAQLVVQVPPLGSENVPRTQSSRRGSIRTSSRVPTAIRKDMPCSRSGATRA